MATYCKLAVRFEEMERRIDEEGYVVESSGGPKANPLIGSCSSIARQMTTMARSLRITPSSRMQHNSASVDRDPPLDAGDKSYTPGIRMAG